MRRTGTRRPRFRLFDRLFLGLPVAPVVGWRGSLIVVQPETVLGRRHRRQISGLNSAVTPRSRVRVGLNPHRPAIARIRGSPLHSRTLRLARPEDSVHPAARRKLRRRAFTSRGPTRLLHSCRRLLDQLSALFRCGTSKEETDHRFRP